MALAVPTAFGVLDGLDGEGRTVDLCQGDEHARALVLETVFLEITLMESAYVGLYPVLEHCLGYVMERADLDVGWGLGGSCHP